MANASKTHFGPGSQGKGSGTGGMTDLPDGVLGDNQVLSNHDKARHNEERGLDSKTVQVEQFQDTVGNHEGPAESETDKTETVRSARE